MNILVATNSLCFGGAENFSIQLHQRFLKEGYTSKYAIFSDDVTLTEKYNIPTETIYSFCKTRKTSIFQMLSQFFAVKTFIINNSIDIVYCCQPQSAIIFWLIRLFSKKIKVVYITMHVYANADRKERLLWYSRLPQLGTDVFIALSDYLALELKKINKIPEKKCFVNRLPVDTEVFQPDPKNKNRHLFNLPTDKKLVGISCRLYPVKRINLFIECFKYLKNIDNTEGVIFGDGPEKSRLEALIVDNNLLDKVKIYPFTNELYKVLPTFDIYLQTSEGPNLGLVTLEAFSSGVPVIMLAENATEEFMIDDTYCGRNVGKIAYPNPKKIAKSLDNLLADEVLLAQISQNARQLAEDKYSWFSFMDRLNDLHKILDLKHEKHQQV